MASTANSSSPETGLFKDDPAQPTFREDSEKLEEPEQTEYPHGLKLLLLMTSIFLCMFLVALVCSPTSMSCPGPVLLTAKDRTIIATAIPQITDEFHSEGDVGWYGSAYLLAICIFQLPFGKLYSFLSVKWTYLSCIVLFMVSSALCGAAPTSDAFIVGRALAGVGAAGLLCGNILVLTYSVPLHKRPVFQGIFGALFGITSLIGPLLGGGFTTDVTWRWCFYINLPFGAASCLFVLLLLEIPDSEPTNLTTVDKLRKLDPIGFSMLAPGVVCLLLALQWGGSTYAWSDWRIILLLVLAGSLLLGFAAIQVLTPKTATLPRRVLVQRSILSGFYTAFCNGSQQVLFQFYLPIWFQAVEGVTALESGIRTLPIVIATVVASVVTGILTSKIGYYTPFLIVGVCLISTGAGLLTTLHITIPESTLIGYQAVYGLGMGLGAQAPNMAAQTVLPKEDVSIGVALMFFAQLLGGAVFTSLGESVLNNRLLAQLSDVAGFNASSITDSGATMLTQLSSLSKDIILPAYNDAITLVFRVGLGLSCAAIAGALSMEWKSVKKSRKVPNVQADIGESGSTEIRPGLGDGSKHE